MVTRLNSGTVVGETPGEYPTMEHDVSNYMVQALALGPVSNKMQPFHTPIILSAIHSNFFGTANSRA